jgi:hypothetical protein
MGLSRIFGTRKCYRRSQVDTGTTCISTTWNHWSDATTIVGVRGDWMYGNFEVRVGNFWTLGRTRIVNERRRQKHFVVDWWADSDSDLSPRLSYIIIAERSHYCILYAMHTADLALTPHAFNLIILLQCVAIQDHQHRIKERIFDLVCQCGQRLKDLNIEGQMMYAMLSSVVA